MRVGFRVDYVTEGVLPTHRGQGIQEGRRQGGRGGEGEPSVLSLGWFTGSDRESQIDERGVVSIEFNFKLYFLTINL